jgi:hypothetical protein
MPTTKEDVEAFCREQAVPRGVAYTLVLASLTKRWLAEEMTAEYRMKFLTHLDKMTTRDIWLTAEMIGALEPMCDRGYEIVREAHKLGANKSLDVFADVFATFAVLNPSLISVLQMSPIHQARTKREFTAEELVT